MKGEKKWKLFVKLGVFLTSLFAIFVINSKNTNAIVPLTGRSIHSLSYRLNNSSSNLITVNSINNNTMSPRINLTVGPNSSSSLLTPVFNLNNSVKLGPEVYFKLSLKVSLGVSTVYVDSQPNVSFVCPQGDYNQKLFVSSCEIKTYNKTTQSWEVNYLSNGQIQDMTSDYYEEDFYIDIIVYSSETDRTYNNIPFLGRFFSVYNSSSSGNLIGILQFTYVESTSFHYEETGADKLNKKDTQDRSNLNNQQDDVDSDSDTSQQDAQNTGTTLITAFSSFVSTLTSARPSNCNLDMDLGNLDLGVVNFCTLSPPPEFQTLASVFLILFCVPLSIATARKLINLFRSFQG